jgi:hypothetical protein
LSVLQSNDKIDLIIFHEILKVATWVKYKKDEAGRAPSLKSQGREKRRKSSEEEDQTVFLITLPCSDAT